VAANRRQDRHAAFAGTAESLMGDLIRAGVTGVSGSVDEPYLDAAIRPDILFPAYASGRNLAESFYAAMPYLSWQTLVVGDPLCAPFPHAALAAGQVDSPLDTATEEPTLFARWRLGTLPPALSPRRQRSSGSNVRNDTAGARLPRGGHRCRAAIHSGASGAGGDGRPQRRPGSGDRLIPRDPHITIGQARAAGGRDAAILWHAAVIYAANNNVSEAAAELSSALKADPNLANRDETQKLSQRLNLVAKQGPK
jgi:hypothetical protein